MEGGRGSSAGYRLTGMREGRRQTGYGERRGKITTIMVVTGAQQLFSEQVTGGAWVVQVELVCIDCVAAVKPAPLLAPAGIEPLPDPGQTLLKLRSNPGETVCRQSPSLR